MAAIYGVLGEADAAELAAIGSRLSHRGSAGATWSPGAGVHLGIRATAPEADRQAGGPVAFDGVIDNRRELAKLLGRRHPDDVAPDADAGLVHELVATRGLEELGRLAGQFALALWLPDTRRLILARDRIGYAPLYFVQDGGRLIFASEYKALLAIASVPAVPDRDTLQVIQSTKWHKPGATSLKGIYPVAPGSYLELTPGTGAMWSARYWDIPVRVEHHDEVKHASDLREVFLASLGDQVAPYSRIGISLSGGLDSAIMAAGVRRVAGDREVHTFSAGYGADDRELVNAGRVAAELGTTHHPLVMDPDDLPTLLPWMVWHTEEAIGREDVAYLYVAAREAARYVDLIVTGFGFDGLFAGLPRHRLVDLGIKYPLVRRPMVEFFDYTFRSVEPRTLAGRALQRGYFRGREFPAPQVLGASPLAPLSGFVTDGDQPLTSFLRRGFLVLPYQSPVERLYAGAGVRMNAHHTDPRFLRAAFSIPDNLKIRGRTQKYILRKACAGLISDGILATGKSFNRLKHDTRMSETLDAMADELLAPHILADRGLFDPGYVDRLRRRAPGKPYGQERAYRLWSLLLTELWSQAFVDRRGAPPPAPPPPIRRLECTSGPVLPSSR
jgi:asparagine synthase (glutamine-hydrolysing)